MRRWLVVPCVALLSCSLFVIRPAAAAVSCAATLSADVVVLDQPLMFNRLGAQNVNGIVYALRRDVVNATTRLPLTGGGAATPGEVMLRPDKRPRPLVLRVAAGSCLSVRLTNLLTTTANPGNPPHPALAIDDQVASRWAGFHVQGLNLAGSIADDGSNAGKNGSSLVAPGGTATYTYYAPKEGAYLVTSHGATFGADGSAGNSTNGMFAVVNVEPPGARFYRSQVTEEELRLATTGTTSSGQPILDYGKRYPADCDPAAQNGIGGVWCQEGKAGLPVLAMVDGDRIVHSDLNAIVAGPNEDGTFPPSTYPLESVGKRNPSLPNRLEAFREYTVVFHDESAVANAFPRWYSDPVLRHTLHAVGDVFMVNYGSGGVGSEVIANRLGVGPMHDCLNCAYEEFFLASSAVGDPAMVVDTPANVGLEDCRPDLSSCLAVGPKATRAFYPDDPSNVHHSYTGDFTKFRNVHTGKEHHIFHLHNHQWLFNPNDDNANYLDAQAIGPGGGYTYEINFGGSGNRNKSAGDAIFHCHLYPHFAQGMWELWRNHDVLETGTPLEVSGGPGGFHSEPFALRDGTPAAATGDTVRLKDPTNPAVEIEVPAARARALPDGEILAGTPIPALVPLPGKPMAVLPGKVSVVPKISNGVTVGSVAQVDRTDVDAGQRHPTLNPAGIKNPGFPFWIAGVESTVGQRSTTPPLDMDPGAGGFDGGLPRHALDGYAASGCPPGTDRAACAVSKQTRLDMTKELVKAAPVWFPEEGTDVEKAAMAFHAVRKHPSTALRLGGPPVPGDFVTNGSGRPVPGAPFHDPCVDDAGNLLRTGQPAAFFSWDGLNTTGTPEFGGDRPRVYKGANIQFDAVLNKLGYHYPQQRIISLWQDALPIISKAKPPEPLVMRMNTFDCVMYHHTNLVPSVYELDDYQIRTTTDIIGQHIHLPKWDLTTTDGSANGWNYEDGTLSPDAVRERIHAINAFEGGDRLQPAKHPFFPATGPGGANWLGARTTLERWFSDPVVNVDGVHRGLGIIFTHDHFGPSTHQQIGLYGTVLVEPPRSRWVHNETGVALYTRDDGGPTSWQAAILTPNAADSHREFYFEYTDFQHAYKPGVYVGRDQAGRIIKGPPDVDPPDPTTYQHAVNPSFKQALGAGTIFPDLLAFPPFCPGGVPRPCPEAISADDPGFMVVNYRNEPLAFRVYDPAKPGPDGLPGSQADGLAGDLAFALQSRTDRKLTALNVQPAAGGNINGTLFPPPINAGGLTPGDPFTPMPRAYFGDNVRIKVQAGGDEESHNATVHGAKWLQGGSGFGFAPNSGWRASQHAGISEQFTFAAPALPMMNGGLKADHLYTMNASMDGFWNGAWGIFRTYGQPQSDLFRLPSAPALPLNVTNKTSFRGVCPTNAVVRTYDVTAVLANDVLGNAVGATVVPGDGSERMNVGAKDASGVSKLNPGGGTLVYNPRSATAAFGGPLHDPTALMYVRTADLEPRNPSDATCRARNGKVDPTLPGCAVQLRPTRCDSAGRCTPGAPVEPLVLRAAAGECVSVTLRNRLPAVLPDLAGYKHLSPINNRRVAPEGVTTFNNNLLRPSSYVALHPSLVAYDVNKDDGLVVGVNGLGNDGAGIVVPPGGKKTIQWYAGDLSLKPVTGGVAVVATPVEFGGTNLGPADVVKQGQKGLVGALVLVPEKSTWSEGDLALDHQLPPTGKATEDCSASSGAGVAGCRSTRASATVNGSMRDLVAVVQKGMNHRYANGSPAEMIAGEGPVAEDAEDSGHMGINYGSEPMWYRFGRSPATPLTGPGGLGDVPAADQAHSNALAGGDPATPVFLARAGDQTRLHLLAPSGTSRASSFTLHGHSWQRDPYVCPSANLLPGRCLPTGFVPTAPGFEVASRALGVNPVGIAMGAQDLVMPGAHFTLLLERAGGVGAVRGDYLFMDRAGFGTTSGLWSLLRVR